MSEKLTPELLAELDEYVRYGRANPCEEVCVDTEKLATVLAAARRELERQE